MATLINGDGNLAIAAAQDADWFALKLTGLMGAQTSTWTLKDPAHYAQVKGQFDLYTFEGFAMQ